MTFLGLSPGQKLVGQLVLALASVHLGAFQMPVAGEEGVSYNWLICLSFIAGLQNPNVRKNQAGHISWGKRLAWNCGAWRAIVCPALGGDFHKD